MVSSLSPFPLARASRAVKSADFSVKPEPQSTRSGMADFGHGTPNPSRPVRDVRVALKPMGFKPNATKRQSAALQLDHIISRRVCKSSSSMGIHQPSTQRSVTQRCTGYPQGLQGPGCCLPWPSHSGRPERKGKLGSMKTAVHVWSFQRPGIWSN